MLKPICPICKGCLENSNCNTCNISYPVVKNIPHLLARNISELKNQEISFYTKEFKNMKSSYDYVLGEDAWSIMRFMEFFKDLHFDSDILELGAGNGQYNIALRKKGYRNIICSDIAASGLIDAQEFAQNNNLSAENSFYVIDSENIPFCDESFDCIFLTASLHHFENVEKVILEIKRCLKLGGKAIIALEPNKWYFYMVRPIAKLFKLRRIQREGTSSIADEKTTGFTMSELVRLCTSNKLKLEGTQRVWYLAGILYYFEDFYLRVSKKNIAIPRGLKKIAHEIDRIIEKTPLINSLSFHNTVCVKKH